MLRRNKGSRETRRLLEKYLAPGYGREVFRAYYLANQKVDELFDQWYGGLTEYAREHGQELAPKLGFGAKTSRLLAQLVAEIAPSVGIDAAFSRGTTQRLTATTTLRLNLLRALWDHHNGLKPLSEIDPADHTVPNTLVTHTGDFLFDANVGALSPTLPLAQVQAIERQKRIEEELDNEQHSVFYIQKPLPAVALLSHSLITKTGGRFLPHHSGEPSSTVLVGATIGLKKNLLFLDPLAIGENVAP